MNARRFDGIAKTLSSGANRRGVLAGLVGGLVAPLGSRGGALAGNKRRYCRKAHPRRCKGYTCGGQSKPCDVGLGHGLQVHPERGRLPRLCRREQLRPSVHQQRGVCGVADVWPGVRLRGAGLRPLRTEVHGAVPTMSSIASD